MAEVGAGVGHKAQTDELDSEISVLEAQMRQPQQPVREQDAVPQGEVPQHAGEVGGDGMVEAVTSVEEFEQQMQVERKGPDAGQQEAGERVEPQPQQAQTTGRRSWKTDFLELENRYVKLRQASDHFKFETKQQIAGLQESLLAYQKENDALRSQASEAKAASQKGDVLSAFTQDDVDVLGESTLTSVQNAISTAVSSATQPLQLELLAMKKAERDRLKASVASNKKQAYQSFEQQLGNLVPDYPTINSDPEFIKWLNQQSTYGGAPRIKFLHRAEEDGDVERVAHFFVEFKQFRDAPKAVLEQNIVPGGRGGGSQAVVPQAPQEKKVFSMAFINKFYDDDIKGLYKGRQALRDKLDAEIDLALTEGRVV